MTSAEIELPQGLTSEAARQRHAAGEGNDVETTTARSVWGIVRSNVFTRFNAIISALAVVVFVFGEPIDAVFALVMIFNSLIGIVQEVRAKRSLDALQVLVVPMIGVQRDGELVRLPPAELVRGDVVWLESGDQIPVDGQVLVAEGLETDESALTGESEPVPKDVGEEVFSGSVVVAGTAWIEATRVGEASWVHRLTREAKDFVLTQSELRVGVDTLLRVVSWILPPLGALLVWSQLRSSANVADGLVWAVAGVVALIPQGLVLLVSMALAVAVVRLARAEVIVQELPAVEGLARVDVLCVDKTGTLTTGALEVERVEPLDDRDVDDVRAGLAALAQLDAARSSTMDAIGPVVESWNQDWQVRHVVPFSSVRKWSGATYDDHGSWLLGAPEILAAGIPSAQATELLATVESLTGRGRRVLLLAHSSEPCVDDEMPDGLRPAALVALKEELRPDAAETLEYFRRQHVSVRVISGDHPRTVSAVAEELGISGADRYVDMREVDDPAELSADTTVFGRVTPEQKRELVRRLQAEGHTVAMTGDGVNDIPSLKAADIGIAMNTATPATKATAQLVLVDGRFARLPGVVAEGRRVIANMERVSSLFVTKTVYAATLALVVGIVGDAFPFLPRHFSLIAALTIGVPGFALSFRSSDQPCRPGYLNRVLRFAVPAGLVAATATLSTYWLTKSALIGATLDQARTAATMTLTLVGLWILYRLVRPVGRLEIALLASLAAVFVGMVVPSPISELYALELPPLGSTLTILGVLGACIALLESALDVAERRQWWPKRDA